MRKSCVQPSKKGKERDLDKTDPRSGIPSQYIRPAEPIQPPKAREVSLNASENTMAQALAHLRHLHVSAPVVAVGRVGTWYGDGGERYLTVDRAIPLKGLSDDRELRASDEGYVMAVADPNDESRHMLDALRLSDTEYVHDFVLPDPPPMGEKDSTAKREPLRQQFNSSTARSMLAERPVKRLRTLGGSPGRKGPELRKRRLGNTGAIVSSQRSDGQLHPRAVDTASTSDKSERQMSSDPTIKASSTRSGRGCSPPPKRRQLRDFRKLPDASMKEDTFRVYVEKHIRDCCCADHDSEQDSSPPAFAFTYLLKVQQLRAFAERIVCVALQAREARRRRAAADVQTAAGGPMRQSMAPPLTPARPTKSSADVSKVESLYAAVVRTLLSEGTIVVADPVNTPQAPFDGKRSQERGTPAADEDRDGSGSADRTMAGHSFTTARAALGKATSVTSADTSRFSSVRAAARQKYGSHIGGRSHAFEAYQLVTPELLATPIRQMLSAFATKMARKARTGLALDGASPWDPHRQSLSTDVVLARLRASDVRWRYISAESVAAALSLVEQQQGGDNGLLS